MCYNNLRVFLELFYLKPQRFWYYHTRHYRCLWRMKDVSFKRTGIIRKHWEVAHSHLELKQSSQPVLVWWPVGGQLATAWYDLFLVILRSLCARRQEIQLLLARKIHMRWVRQLLPRWLVLMFLVSTVWMEPAHAKPSVLVLKRFWLWVRSNPNNFQCSQVCPLRPIQLVPAVIFSASTGPQRCKFWETGAEALAMTARSFCNSIKEFIVGTKINEVCAGWNWGMESGRQALCSNFVFKTRSWLQLCRFLSPAVQTGASTCVNYDRSSPSFSI